MDDVTSELRARVQERLRVELVRHGGSPALEDPLIFSELDALLRRAVSRSRASALLMPEILGDPSTWRLETAIRYSSHRGRIASTVVTSVKRFLMMPLVRWFFEYGRDNFERQRRVNEVLFACIQELAIENARLRQELGPPASK